MTRSSPMASAPASAQLRLEQVSLTIGRVSLLQDVSFQVFPGDRLALVGAAGSGKSSLLRLLNRLIEPTAGQIFFQDQSLRSQPAIALRRQIVLVPQEGRLLGQTVQQALAYPLRLQGLSAATIQQRVATWMELLHLPEDWLGRSEVQLSVGQRYWVTIARALVMQPQILLLDEPTAALDAGRADRLLQVLDQWSQAQPASVIMVNHQLDLAQQFSNRLLYLQRGSLTELPSATAADWLDLKRSLTQAATELDDWD